MASTKYNGIAKLKPGADAVSAKNMLEQTCPGTYYFEGEGEALKGYHEFDSISFSTTAGNVIEAYGKKALKEKAIEVPDQLENLVETLLLKENNATDQKL